METKQDMEIQENCTSHDEVETIEVVNVEELAIDGICGVY